MNHRNAKCMNCHFFCKKVTTARADYSDVEITTSEEPLEKYEIDKIQKKEINPDQPIGCYRSIWFVHTSVGRFEERVYDYASRERSNCFYFPKSEHISFEGAVLLEERAAEHQTFKNQIRRTNFGLIIAAVGLLASTFFSILNHYFPKGDPMFSVLVDKSIQLTESTSDLIQED